MPASWQREVAITERQYRALLEAMEHIVATWCKERKLSVRMIQERIRILWGVRHERELLQSDFPAITDYLHQWLLTGDEPHRPTATRIELLRCVHELREALGWDVKRLQNFAKQCVGSKNLRQLRREQLQHLVDALKALRQLQ